MAKKDYDQFPGVVCELMRNIAKEQKKVEAKRKRVFEERDNADNASREQGIAEADKEKHDAEYGRAVRELDELAQKLKFLAGQMTDLVNDQTSAEPKLIEIDSPKVDWSLFTPKSTRQAEKGEKPEKDEDVAGQNKFAGTEQPEGEDQHLEADINELDLPTGLTATLREHGFNKVGDLAARSDSPEGLPDMRGVGVAKVAEIENALKAFRKKHRAAARTREEELAAT